MSVGTAGLWVERGLRWGGPVIHSTNKCLSRTYYSAKYSAKPCTGCWDTPVSGRKSLSIRNSHPSGGRGQWKWVKEMGTTLRLVWKGCSLPTYYVPDTES